MAEIGALLPFVYVAANDRFPPILVVERSATNGP